MFSAWLIGLEDAPERCAEICVVEVFGDTVGGARAAVGSGIKAFRDPALVEDFVAEARDIDIRDRHRWSVRWSPGRVELAIDRTPARTLARVPDYPMPLMIAVFGFPSHPDRDPTDVPELVVRRVRHTPSPEA